MKIRLSELKQIIREEIGSLLNEQEPRIARVYTGKKAQDPKVLALTKSQPPTVPQIFTSPFGDDAYRSPERERTDKYLQADLEASAVVDKIFDESDDPLGSLKQAFHKGFNPKETGTMGSFTVEDIEYLARMVILEQGASHGETSGEWAGMMNAAINRARIKNTSVKDIVTRISWPGSGPYGKAYIQRIQSSYPINQQTWLQALKYATLLVMGKKSNPIGRRQLFVHPRSLKRTEQPTGTIGKDKRGVPKSISLDGKWYPLWMVMRNDPRLRNYPEARKLARAPNAVISIGQAKFA